MLPDSLSLAAIDATKERIRVTAIQRRDGWERVEELDKHQADSSGAEIEMRAFRRVVTRGLVAFEWDLQTNVALLQISQLPAHHRYEDIFKDFRLLTRAWLPVDRFPVLALGKAIGALYNEAKQPAGNLRAHGVEFEATDGRRLTGRSKQAKQPLDGNRIIDTALDSLQAAKGTGQLGNFFFVTEQAGATDEELWSEDTHVVLMAGGKNRINFTTPQDEETIRDVLQRIRAAC